MFPPSSVVGTMLLIRRPANVVVDNTLQVSPPSVERTTPKPGLPTKLKLLVLPVPANKIFSFTGPIARERMDNAGNWRSVVVVQAGLEEVPFIVFQIPPLTVPTKTRSGFVGLAAIALIAPATGLFGSPSVRPFVIGPGPCSTHTGGGGGGAAPIVRTTGRRRTYAMRGLCAVRNRSAP